MSKKNRLNERQREFARLVSKGMKQAQAYRKAFDCKEKSGASIASAASRLAKNVEVLRFLAELSAEKDESARMAREERMALLSKMAMDAKDAGDVRAAVACIAELNKMDGAYVAEAAAAARDDAFRAAILRGTSEPLVRGH